MDTLRLFLFGKFHGSYGDRALRGLEARKAQELFCYLLLYRDRPHPREALSDRLWSDTESLQSRNYLRKALWQLQMALNSNNVDGNNLLMVEPDWLQLNVAADFWLDIAVFEQTFHLFHGIQGKDLTPEHAQMLRQALDLYRGDLLEGWYTDWCLLERERLQYIYLAMLDKLMDYCETQHDYESGIVYGMQSLQYDQARERTHQQMMRLQYLAGDRTTALRQYERCVTALDQLFGVQPTEHTVSLYEQIRADSLLVAISKPTTDQRTSARFVELLNDLKKFRSALGDLQFRVQQDISKAEELLKRVS